MFIAMNRFRVVPEGTAEFEQVWLWNDWPRNWGRDKGIDLIARKYDGRIVAIQVKHYASTYYAHAVLAHLEGIIVLDVPAEFNEKPRQ